MNQSARNDVSKWLAEGVLKLTNAGFDSIGYIVVDVGDTIA